MRESQCPQCGAKFEQKSGRGMARKFCSSECRYQSGRSTERDASSTWSTCSVKGCEKTVRSARAPYCEMHYGRIRRYGSVSPTGKCFHCSTDLPDMRSRFCDRRCKVAWERYARYGLDPEIGKMMEESRAGKCDICDDMVGSLNIDHCHATGEVRGFLCTPCNLGIGSFKDRPEALIRAAEYLNLGIS